MFILDKEKLEIGDVILTRANQKISKVIRKSLGGEFSHAILYITDSSYIHSDREGVHSGNIQRLLFEESSDVQVFRVNKSINIYDVCFFARTQIGKEYSVKEAVNSKVKINKLKIFNRQFCSKLVAESFAHAGLLISDNPSRCTPADIEKSTSFKLIEGCVRKATIDEVDFARNTDDPSENQAKITNDILAFSREKTGEDIQTLIQLEKVIYKNNQYDIEISDYIIKSGYLDILEYDKNKNPWRYNIASFDLLGLDSEKQVEVAKRELNSGQDQLKRYKLMLEKYDNDNKLYRLKYTEIFYRLYEKICGYMNERIDTARQILHKNNLTKR